MTHTRLYTRVRGPPHLVEAYEGGHPYVLGLEEGHTLLGGVDGVHQDVVQGATAGGDGHVVLLIDSPEVPLEKNTRPAPSRPCVG